MKNTKLYYFLQLGIVAVSLATFMKFTYPYLTRDEVKSSNELSQFLQQRSGDSDVVPTPTEPKKHYSVVRPPSSPYVSAKPRSLAPPKVASVPETFKRDLSVEPEDNSETNKKIESSPARPETFRQQIHVEGSSGPVNINKHIIVDKKEPESIKGEGLTLDKVDRFFKFTSSIVGTIFPLIGFTMTVLLWRNQRKEKKVETVEV